MALPLLPLLLVGGALMVAAGRKRGGTVSRGEPSAGCPNVAVYTVGTKADVLALVADLNRSGRTTVMLVIATGRAPDEAAIRHSFCTNADQNLEFAFAELRCAPGSLCERELLKEGWVGIGVALDGKFGVEGWHDGYAIVPELKYGTPLEAFNRTQEIVMGIARSRQFWDDDSPMGSCNTLMPTSDPSVHECYFNPYIEGASEHEVPTYGEEFYGDYISQDRQYAADQYADSLITGADQNTMASDIANEVYHQIYPECPWQIDPEDPGHELCRLEWMRIWLRVVAIRGY
jgi:hypothetical protein